MLSPTQMQRYARHVLLPEVGRDGQGRLLAAQVEVRGTGRAAEEAARYLCAAGIGSLRLDPGLASRLDAELRAMNPDCHLTSTGSPDAQIEGFQADGDRFSGALAALAVLIELGTEHPGPQFQGSRVEGIRWRRC